MILTLLLLVSGVFACATAVIFIKASHIDPSLLAAFRLLGASFFLVPLCLRDLRKSTITFTWHDVKRSMLPGVLLGLHLILWIIGARLTLAANSSLIVNMVPVAMPFFLFLLSRELLNVRELIGTALAMIGVFVLARFDFRWDLDLFRGDVSCFVSMLLLTWYLAFARRHRKVASFWLYITPVYFVGGVFCLVASVPVALLLGFPLPDVSAVANSYELTMVLALVLIPTVCGHSVLNYCMRRLRGQLVAIVNLSQFMFAAVLAFLILGEKPAVAFYAACVPIFLGALIAILFTPQETNT